MARRVERFALQSVARDILPDSRTAKCLRIRAHDKDVQVWKSRTTRQQATAGCRPAGASGRVLSVGLRWSRGAGKIQQAMAMHRACGGEVHLLTLTVPHTRFDVLETLLERQGKTLKASCVTERSRRYSRKWATSARFAAMRRPTGARHQQRLAPALPFPPVRHGQGDAAQLMDWRTRLYLRWDVYCQKGRPWLALLPAWPRPA